MKLEAGIAALVEEFIAAGRPSSRAQSIKQRRDGYIAELGGEIEPVAKVETIDANGIRLRLYHPQPGKILPVVIYYHGGCFISGDFATHERQLRQVANQAQVLVIAVEYRLAPEHIYPAAHDDALAAANYIRENANALGGNADQICLMGDSAGGHIALVTGLRLKNAGSWLPAKLVLIYPMLDASGSSQSYKTNGDDYIITRDTLLSGFEYYLGTKELGNTEKQHPEASPLYRDDFNGLPKTHIISAEFDPLHDECEHLFQRLQQQNVRCTYTCYQGVIHGFFQLASISRSSQLAIEQVSAWVREMA
ncbi:alpha/beta hydrolase [Edaphovirga cremea]|uniref:alpha/beta hydrolase n=1 Tax=Edaphovirga cremea TaxID=2267246 RepID=UPI000DEF213F|nr:alpha/beta hydrolase [Edaphovirga cremea]